MHGFTKRAFALVLVFILCASMWLTLPVFAESGSSTASSDSTTSAYSLGEGDARFIFKSLSSQKGMHYLADTAPVTLTLAADDAVFEAKSVSPLSTDSNAFYLSVVNQSNATRVRISYTYLESAAEKTDTVEQVLTPNSVVTQSFVIKATYLSSIRSLNVEFLADDTLSGDVTLSALFDLSTYFNESTDEATLTRCHYDAKSKSVEIEGELGYETTVLYAGKSLALFTLTDTEGVHLSGKTPIAKTGVSFKFTFSVEATTADAIFSRYVVAAVSEQGEMIPLCAPRYPSFTTQLSGEESGFKGFQGATLSEALDVTPDVEIVDVYLDRMYGTQGSGILHSGEHAYYYFNTEYVNEIDCTVRNLTGCGTHVYLRFLVSGDANNLTYADHVATDKGIVSKLPVIRNDQARYDLYAVVDFLTARYTGGEDGRISGVVLGRAADRASLYSYATASSLEEYVSLYAMTYNLIAGATLCNVPDARIVLPVSDRIFTGYATAGQLTGDYYTTFFLPSLITALQENSLSPIPMTLMLTSETLPDCVAKSNGKTYGADRIAAFMNEWSALRSTCTFLDSKIFYIWQTNAGLSADELSAAYVALYLILYARNDVSTFIPDLSLANEDAIETLAYLARYIDTDKFAEVTQSAFGTIGRKATEIVPSLDIASLKTRTYHYATLEKGSFSSGLTPTGSHSTWNFATASDTLGWYSGADCRTIAVQAETRDTRALTATLLGKGDYADIAYHWAAPTDLSFAPYFSLDVGVTGNTAQRYEIQLRLYGESDVTISTAIVMLGSRETLCLDLTGMKTALSSLRCIRITARPLDGATDTFTLSTYALTLGSDTLDDTALAERMAGIMQSGEQEESESVSKRDITRPLIATIVVVLASGAVIALLIVRRTRKKQLKKKTTTEKKQTGDKKAAADKKQSDK